MYDASPDCADALVEALVPANTTVSEALAGEVALLPVDGSAASPAPDCDVESDVLGKLVPDVAEGD